MKGLKKLKTDASFVLGEMMVDLLDSKDKPYWSDLKYAKKIWKIIDKASKLKQCSCLECGCNELGEIYCEQHYLKSWL